MQSKYLLAAMALLTGLTACYKDEGNYDYQPVNRVEIAGIPDTAHVLRLDTLTIRPVLSFTVAGGSADDTTRYAYEWMTTVITAETPRTTLAQTKDLHAAIGLAAGNYSVFYRVTDKRSGVQFSHRFELKVGSKIAEGWLLLTDRNGKAELDMISILSGASLYQQDLLAVTAPDMPGLAGPGSIEAVNAAGTFSYYVSTAQGTHKLSNTLTWAPANDIKYEFYANTPPGFAPDKVYSAGGNNILVYVAGEWFHQHTALARGYGVNINRVKGEAADFKAAPFVADAGTGTGSASLFMLYDDDNRRFVRFSRTAGTTALSTGPLFNFNTGRQLLYMGTNRISNETHAVLKDNNGKLYIYRFNLNGGIITQTHFAELTAPDITSATRFEVSPDLGYLFYLAGGRLYEYDLFLKKAFLMADFGADAVTVLQFQRFMSVTNRPEWATLQTKLLVATFNTAAQSGKLSLFNVPPRNEPLTLFREYTGLGKIKAITYKQQ